MSQLIPNKGGLGIRAKLVLLIVAATILVVGISGTYGARESENSIFEAEKERAGAFLESLALPCAIAVATDSLETLDNFMSEAVQSPSKNTRLLSLQMLNHSGLLIMDAEDGSRTQPSSSISQKPNTLRTDFITKAHVSKLPIWERTQLPGGSSVLSMSMPAVSGLRWGTLVASFDLSTYDARIIRLRQYNIFSNIALILALILVLYAGISLLVVKPVHKLTDSMNQLHGGRLETRVRLSTGGEMAALANGFNNMAAELETYTKTLEKKVEERSQEVRRKADELAQVNSQLHDAVKKLETLVRTDELTGIYNRRHLTEVLETETKRSARTGRPLSLAMLDVDHFKSLNDEYGHAVGDHVLMTVAKLLKDKLRSTDIIARFGGEEFVVILFDTPKSAAHTVAEGLREIIAKTTFDTATVTIHNPVTVSIGIASCPDDGGDASVLLEKADEAMYAAKKNGRNQVTLWDKDHE